MTHMARLTLRYLRYVLSGLSAVAFGVALN